MKEIIQKIICILLLNSYVFTLIPAKEFEQELSESFSNFEFSQLETDNLEDSIDLLKLQSNEFICDEIFWTDDEFVQSEFEDENTENLEKKNSIFLIHKSELYKRLKNAKENFEYKSENNSTRKINIEQIDDVKIQWNKVSNKIIQDYLQEINETNTNSTQILNDFYKMEKEIYNSLLNELLYDQFSLRKEVDKDSAMIVANELATEVEDSTNQTIDKLFNQINFEANEVDAKDIEVTPENWLNDFSKQIESGIEKWNQVEKDFLSMRFEWENSAQENFQKDIETWQNAYDELLRRRDKWNYEINQKIEEGISMWNQKGDILFSQISQLEEDTQNELYEQLEQKKQYLLANQQMYSQTRVLLASTQKNIITWAQKWTEKYDGIYSYWKTESDRKKADLEAAEKEAKKHGASVDKSKWNIPVVEENPLKQIILSKNIDVESITKIIQKVKSKIIETIKYVGGSKLNYFFLQNETITYKSPASKITQMIKEVNKNSTSIDKNLIHVLNENNVLWENLDLLQSWLNIYKENSSNLQKYKSEILLTLGYSNSQDSVLTFSELNSEILEQTEITNYWKEQVQIAQYVYDYTLDQTSFVDTLQDTKQKLQDATDSYEKINLEYKGEVEKLNLLEQNYINSKNEYSQQKEKVENLFIELESAQNSYNALKENITAIELKKLKEKIFLNVNSVNIIGFNSFENEKTLNKYYEELEYFEYVNIVKNGQKFIEEISKSQVIQISDFDLETQNQYAQLIKEQNDDYKEKVITPSLQELEKIVNNKTSNNEECAEEQKTLLTKKAQIEFIKTGDIKENFSSEIDVENIKKELSNYSLIYKKTIDDNTKDEINKIIENKKAKNQNYYLLMSDLELEEFFKNIVDVIEKNDCSDFIKTQVSLYKNQILKARNEKVNKEFISKVKNTFEQCVINEKDFFIENYSNVFKIKQKEEEFSFDLFKEQIDVDRQNNAQTLLSILFLDEQNYDKIICVLQKSVESYIQKESDFNTYSSSLDQYQEDIKNLEEKYKSESNALNQNKSINFYSSMVKEFELYENQLKQVQKKYEEVKSKKLNLESCQQLYTWAENQYLHLHYNSQNVFDPIEKLDFSLSKYQESSLYKKQLEEILHKKSTINNIKIYDEFGNDLIADYEKKYSSKQTAKVLKEEFSLLLQNYKDELFDSQIQLYNSIYDLVDFEENENLIDENKLEFYEFINRFVIVEKSTENSKKSSYQITLNKPKESKIIEEEINEETGLKKQKERIVYSFSEKSEQEKELLQTNIIDYLSDRQIVQYDIYGNEHLFSISSKDCIDFLTSFDLKNYSIDDLMLASCYLKIISNDESVFFENENPTDEKNYPFGLPKEEILGIELKSVYKNGMYNEIKKAYEKVANNNGSDDIAKFLFFSTYCVDSAFDFQEREKNLIASLGYETVLKDVKNASSKFYQEAVGCLASAALMTPLLWCCPWLSVVVAALSLIAATDFSNSDSLDNVADDIERLQDNYNQIVGEFNNLYDSNLSNYILSKLNRDNLQKRYCQALYGKDTFNDFVLTFEDFDFSLKNIFGKENETSIKYDFFKNLEDVSKEQSSFEDLFNTATAGKNCTDVLSALECIYDYINTIEYEAFEQLENRANQKRIDHNSNKETAEQEKIQLLNFSKLNDVQNTNLEEIYNKLFLQDSWNEEAYQKKLLSIRTNFFNNVPILLSRNSEDYILDLFEEQFFFYENFLVDSYSNILNQKKNSNKILIQDFNYQFEQWQNQMKFILDVADSEWNKAEQLLNSDFYAWQKIWSQKYEQVNQSWNSEYEDFLAQKNEWINEQYIAGALSGIIEEFDQEKFEQKTSEIKLKAKNIVSNENTLLLNFSLPEDFNQKYFNSIYDSSLFNYLNNFTTDMNSNINDFNVQQNFSKGLSFNDFEKMDKINSAIKSLENQMTKAASLNASQIAQDQIYETIDFIYDSIEAQNKNFEKWEFDFVRKDGYSVGNEISRNAIVDSTMTQNVIREKQTVHKYEWFKCAYPLLTYNLANFSYLDSDSMQALMAENFDQLNNWQIEILGNPRNNSDSDSSIGEKSIAEMSAFEKHLGQAPVFVKNIDTKKSREENVQKNGSGQLGLILLDFTWNSALHSEGYAALGTPLYDKKITRDNKFLGFELPTLREITEIICEIAANATGQKWISFVDDILYTGLDVRLGQMTANEAFNSFAKKSLSSLVSSGVGSMASGLSNGIDVAINKAGTKGFKAVFDKTIANGISQIGTSYLSGVANEMLNAVDFSKGFDIDWNRVGSAWTNSSVITSALGAGISSSVSSLSNYGLGKVFLEDGVGMNLSNVFNTEGISRFVNTTSTIGANFAQMAVTGNAQFNILGSNDLGIAGDNVGFLSINFNRDSGISAKVSSSGTSLELASLTKNIFDGSLTQALKIGTSKIDNLFAQKEKISTVNAINALGFSGSNKNIQFAKAILNDKAKVIFDSDLDKDILGQFNSEESSLIRINSSLINNSKESAVKLASVFAHEGTHYNGNRLEGVAHFVGYNTYQQLSDTYKTQKDSALVADMISTMKNKDSWKENEGDIDNWLFKADGTIVDDGKNYFSVERVSKDDNGNHKIDVIENSGFDCDSAEALANAISPEVLQQYLKKEFNKITDFSDEAIMGAIGLDKETIKYMKAYGGDDFIDNQKLFNTLIGYEFLLASGNKKVDGIWKSDEAAKQNATVELKVQGLKSEESLNVRCSPNGKFEFYTVNAYLYRDADSFNAYALKNGKIETITAKNAANSHILFEKRNIMSNEEDYLVVSGNLSTIDKLSQGTDKTYISKNGMEVPGNTICSERFKLRFEDGFDWNKKDYNTFVVGIISDAETLNGQHIGEDGRSTPNGARWLFHPTDALGYVKGCFGFNKDPNAKGMWNDLNVEGSGVYNFEKMIYDLREFGVDKGYQISGHMYGQLTPDYYRESATDKEKALENLAKTKKSDTLNVFTPEVPFDPQYKVTPNDVKEVMKNNPVTYSVSNAEKNASATRYCEYISNQINSQKKAELMKEDINKYRTFTRIQEIEKSYNTAFNLIQK